MEIRDLSHDHQVALAGLVEAVAMSDGVVSEGEAGAVGKMAAALGEDAYRQCLEEVESRFADLESLKEYLLTVTDREERELMYGVVVEEIMAIPVADHASSEILEWLRDTWNVVEGAGDETAG